MDEDKKEGARGWLTGILAGLGSFVVITGGGFTFAAFMDGRAEVWRNSNVQLSAPEMLALDLAQVWKDYWFFILALLFNACCLGGVLLGWLLARRSRRDVAIARVRPVAPPPDPRAG
jgi:hypothetical protein